jgi:predicted nucleic acid-binding protein
VILVDAGPLVAIIHADDQWHETCARTFKTLRGPLGTVWPAFTEAMYLLAFSDVAQNALWELCQREVIQMLPLGTEDIPRMRELMHKYRDLPMDLADAALVRVAERDRIRRVFTVDRRDFTLYRPRRIGRFSLVQ